MSAAAYAAMSEVGTRSKVAVWAKFMLPPTYEERRDADRDGEGDIRRCARCIERRLISVARAK